MATMPNADFRQDDELVMVFDTNDEAEANVVRGLLESAGIKAIITNWDAPQDVLPGVGGVTVRVSPEDGEDAKQIVEDYQSRPGDADADASAAEGTAGSDPIAS